MKRALLILSLLALIGALGDLVAPYRDAKLEVRVFDPANPLSAEGPALIRASLDVESERFLRIGSASPGLTLAGYIDVSAVGGPLFARSATRNSAIALGPGYTDCSTDADHAGWRCRIPFRFTGSEWLDLAAVSAPVTVVAIHSVVVQASPRASVAIESLFVGFGVLSLIGLAFLPLNIDAPTKSAILAVLGAFWFVVSSGIGGLTLLAICAGTYFLIRRQLAQPSSLRHLFTVVAAAITLLVVTKVYAMNWGAAFVNPGGLGLGIPLGFGFFVVRALDLSFRVATREVTSTTGREYFSYMLFPATLAAGPLYTLPQFRSAAIERPSLIDWSAGLARIGIGLSKKVLADVLLTRVIGPKLLVMYADPAMPATQIWALLLANTLFVYLDFSGYCDIAIGVGRQLGWRVPENFDFPLARTSMRKFWQTWHMTLSAWVSRWVHFFTAYPLRRAHPALRVALPVVTSLFVMGLWHDIRLTWILWGLHHATGIVFGDFTARLAAAGPLVSATQTVLFKSARYTVGVCFVWAWVALSHCFTLISDPMIALQTYGNALSFGFR